MSSFNYITSYSNSLLSINLHTCIYPAIIKKINNKFWEELIGLLSLHKLTVNNLVAMVTMVHKNPITLLSKARLTNLNLNNFKMVEAMGLKIIACRST
jgi:hypothetical protein